MLNLSCWVCSGCVSWWRRMPKWPWGHCQGLREMERQRWSDWTLKDLCVLHRGYPETLTRLLCTNTVTEQRQTGTWQMIRYTRVWVFLATNIHFTPWKIQTHIHALKHTNTHIYTPRENTIIGQETYGWSVRFLYWKHFLLAQSFVSS